jgi:hypothetical protein
VTRGVTIHQWEFDLVAGVSLLVQPTDEIGLNKHEAKHA